MLILAPPARFFYTAKADSERPADAPNIRCVKPLDLMHAIPCAASHAASPERFWIALPERARLGESPPSARALAPFLIERETEYQNDIRRRMGLLLGGPQKNPRSLRQSKRAH